MWIVGFECTPSFIGLCCNGCVKFESNDWSWLSWKVGTRNFYFGN